MAATSQDILRYKHYEIYRDQVLGGGTFGIVYKGFDTARKRQIAAKLLINTSIEFSRKEIEALSKLTDHDNIVRLYDSFVYGGQVWIITQYCEGHTLDKYMQKETPVLQTSLEVMQQMIEAVQLMHTGVSPKLAHRDLKPQNVIIFRGHQVKICDFGLTKFIESQDTLNATTLGGTPSYMPPEFFKSRVNYDAFKADIFSLGLIMLAVITFCPAERFTHFFQSAKEKSIGERMRKQSQRESLHRKLKDFQHPSQQVMQLISLISTMLAYNPKDRPHIDQVFCSLMEIKTLDCGSAVDVEPATAHSDRTMCTASSSSSHSTAQATAAEATGSSDESSSSEDDDTDTAAATAETAQGTVTAPLAQVATPAPAAAPAPSPTPARTAAPAPSPSPARTAAPAPSPSPARTAAPAPSPMSARTAAPAASGMYLSSAAVPSSVQVVSEHQIQYKAYWHAGLGFHGEVILRDLNNELLHKMDHDGADYSHTWTEHYPAGFSRCWHKAVDNNGDIFLQDKYDTETIHFTQSLVEKGRYRHKGELSYSCGGELFYGQGSLGGRDWRITVHRAAVRPPLTLQPARGDRWYGGLSVCRVQENYVVTDQYTKSMDRFDMNGDLISHRTLNYEPTYPHAITVTNSGHILVAERTPPCIHVYNTQCEELASIGHEQLQLERNDYVYGMKCSSDGLLHVCVGKYGYNITSLHAYRLTS